MPAGITVDRHVANRADRYNGGVTVYVVAIAVLAAAGGMMFGYVCCFVWQTPLPLGISPRIVILLRAQI